MMTLQAGDRVKLTNPQDEAEAQAVYVVVEPRGDRVLIELVCDLPIRPTECVPTSEVELV